MAHAWHQKDTRICVNCGNAFDTNTQDLFGPYTCHYHPDSPIISQEYGAFLGYSHNLFFPCCGVTLFPKINKGYDADDPDASSLPGCINGYHQSDDRRIIAVCNPINSAHIKSLIDAADIITRLKLLDFSSLPGEFDLCLLFIGENDIDAAGKVADCILEYRKTILPYYLEKKPKQLVQRIETIQHRCAPSREVIISDIARTARSRDRFWRWLGAHRRATSDYSAP